MFEKYMALQSCYTVTNTGNIKDIQIDIDIDICVV